jgi:hypothetical protein
MTPVKMFAAIDELAGPDWGNGHWKEKVRPLAVIIQIEFSGMVPVPPGRNMFVEVEQEVTQGSQKRRVWLNSPGFSKASVARKV